MNPNRCIFLLAACLGLLSSQSAGALGLYYRLNPGDRYTLIFSLNQQTRSDSYSDEDLSMSNQMKWHIRVDSLRKDGAIYLRLHYADLQLSMLAPGMGIDLNSSRNENRMLKNLTDSLENKDFHVLMDPNGTLLELHGMEELFAPLYRYPASDSSEKRTVVLTLEEAYGADTFRSLFGLFISVYPLMPMQENWTRDMRYFFNSKPVPLSNSYILNKVGPEGNLIQGIGMLEKDKRFREHSEMGELSSAVSGSQTYDYLMDPITGWPKRCNSRQRILIETTILESNHLPVGLKIPSYTETTFDIRGETSRKNE